MLKLWTLGLEISENCYFPTNDNREEFESDFEDSYKGSETVAHSDVVDDLGNEISSTNSMETDISCSLAGLADRLLHLHTYEGT